MGDKTGIEWTEATWNPIVGCTHVSAGCDHCYAAREASGRLRNNPTYAGLAVEGRFTGEVRLLPQRLEQPLHWRRPRRIFVNSMSDLFHKDVPDEFIARVFAVMALAPQHTFQVLTKRPGRMRSLLASPAFARLMERLFAITAREDLLNLPDAPMPAAVFDPACEWANSADRLKDPLRPLPNVWLGTSVEDQATTFRIEQLRRTPAAVRFLSCEPLLGPIRLFGGNTEDNPPGPGDDVEGVTIRTDYGTGVEHDLDVQPGIDWVIVGGESGPGARPMHPVWARSLRDQCVAAGVPFLFKQAGEVLARQWGCASRKGTDPAEWPEPFPREYPDVA